VGMGMLLAEGIGDTIRVSLATDSVEEVRVGYELLKSLELRSRGPVVIACPTVPLTRQWARAAHAVGLDLVPDAESPRPPAAPYLRGGIARMRS